MARITVSILTMALTIATFVVERPVHAQESEVSTEDTTGVTGQPSDAAEEEAEDDAEAETETGDGGDVEADEDVGEELGEVESEFGTSEPDADEGDPFDAFDGMDQPPTEGRLRDGREEPLEQMQREELEKSGFVFGEGSDGRTSSTATIMALTAGLPLHGVGHLYAGESSAGYFLLVVEAISAGMMVGSGGYYLLAEGASTMTGVVSPIFQLGLAGFVHSWMLDVLGTVQGEDLRLERNTGNIRGISAGASYGFVSAVGSPVRHLISGSLEADFEPVFAAVSTQQDVLLELARYAAQVGARPYYVDSMTYVELRGDGDYLQFRGTGEYDRLGAWGSVTGGLNLGRLYPQFSEVGFSASVGVGHDWWSMPVDDDGAMENVSSSFFVPFDARLSFNFTSRLNFSAGYGSPRLVFMPGPHRLLGAALFDFVYRSSDYADIHLRAEIGDGIAIWIGGRLWMLK